MKANGQNVPETMHERWATILGVVMPFFPPKRNVIWILGLTTSNEILSVKLLIRFFFSLHAIWLCQKCIGRHDVLAHTHECVHCSLMSASACMCFAAVSAQMNI